VTSAIDEAMQRWHMSIKSCRVMSVRSGLPINARHSLVMYVCMSDVPHWLGQSSSQLPALLMWSHMNCNWDQIIFITGSSFYCWCM